MKGFYKVLHRVFATPLRWLFNVRLEGRENEPDADCAFLVCSNHISAWDAVWLYAALKHHKPNFMSKAEIFKIPVLNSIVRFFGAYPVERGGADVASVRYTVELLKRGDCVGMFPQGTRCPGKDPYQTSVKSGVGMIAVRSQAPVLPVYIKTKNHKYSLFGRKTIIMGKIIPNQVIEEMHQSHQTYNNISHYIFDEICSLNSEISSKAE